MSIGVLAIAYTRKRPVSETADALSRLNVPHIVVEDGDPRGLEADALVMIDSCRSFLRYPLMLAQPRARRPATAVWQIEVLPPKELDRSIEAMPVWHMLDKNRSRLSRCIKRWALYPFLSVVATMAAKSRPGRYRLQAKMLEMPLQSFLMIRTAKKAGWLDHVFVSTIQKQEFLESRGVPSTFAPFGISPSSGEDRHLERDIDIVFLGEMKGDRRAKLERLQAELKERGFELRIVDRDCFGEKRTALLNRTKIVLHLHNFEWDTPWMRWMAATACGCVVVSEPLSQPKPFTPGVHYVEAPADALRDTLVSLILDNARRKEIAAACQVFVRENMTLDQSVERIVAWAESMTGNDNNPSDSEKCPQLTGHC